MIRIILLVFLVIIGGFYVYNSLSDSDESDDIYSEDVQEFIITDLKYTLGSQYETFDAYVTVDGIDYYGLGFTDYTKVYTDKKIDYSSGEPLPDNVKIWFAAGVVSFDNNSYQYSDHVNEIHRIDNPDSQFGFVNDMVIDDLNGHFIANHAYVNYSVDHGSIQYKVSYAGKSGSDSFYEILDENLVSTEPLYNYDESNWIIQPQLLNESQTVDFLSSVSLTDWGSIENEVKEMLDTQDKYGVTLSIESVVQQSALLFDAYLTSLKENHATFMGYDVDELIEYSRTIASDQTIVIGNDGYFPTSLNPTPRPGELARAFIGAAALLSIAAATAFPVIGPVLSGALIGASLEVLPAIFDMSTDWTDIAVYATAGAIAGGLAFTNAGNILSKVGKVVSIIVDATKIAYDYAKGRYSLEDGIAIFATGIFLGTAIPKILKQTLSLDNMYPKGIFSHYADGKMMDPNYLGKLVGKTPLSKNIDEYLFIAGHELTDMCKFVMLMGKSVPNNINNMDSKTQSLIDLSKQTTADSSYVYNLEEIQDAIDILTISENSEGLASLLDNSRIVSYTKEDNLTRADAMLYLYDAKGLDAAMEYKDNFSLLSLNYISNSGDLTSINIIFHDDKLIGYGLIDNGWSVFNKMITNNSRNDVSMYVVA